MSTATGYLTTHVLDTARGVPAAGMSIVLYRIEQNQRVELCRVVTNEEGRTSKPLQAGEDFTVGIYELAFSVEAYLNAQVGAKDTFSFFDEIPIRFRVTDPDTHYHVPLLISPYGYSTYRGS